MSATTTRKPKTVVSPAFLVGGAIKAHVNEMIVTLVGGGGSYEVFVQTAPALPTKIGRVTKNGTGWDARFIGDKTTGPSFVGDHYPTRTGKHTQTYALCYLIARAIGFDSATASYGIKYDGVGA